MTAIYALLGPTIVASLAWPPLPTNARDATTGPFDAWDGALYFPGDPPFADMLLLFGAWLALAGFVFLVGIRAVELLHRRHLGRIPRIGYLVASLPVITGIAAMAYSAAVLLGRHSGEWAELKALVERHPELAAWKPPPDLLVFEKDGSIRLKEKPPHVSFASRAFKEPVKVRAAQSPPHYISVDFGEGRNATFELPTMVCVYSD